MIIKISLNDLVCNDIFGEKEPKKLENIKGFILLNTLKFSEKQDLIEKFSSLDSQSKQTEFAFQKLVSLVQEFEIKVNFEGEEFAVDSLDDLGGFDEGVLLISELIARMMKGFSLGKTKKRG